MIRSVIATLFGLSLLASSSAFAGERTVTLTVQNMYCSACPITVKSSLEAVPGVAKAVVYYEDKTAVVTFDDAKTAVPALISAQRLIPDDRSLPHHDWCDRRNSRGDVLRDVPPCGCPRQHRSYGLAGKSRLRRYTGAVPRGRPSGSWALSPPYRGHRSR